MKRFLIPALSCAVLTTTSFVPAQVLPTERRYRQTKVLPPSEAAPTSEKLKAKYVKAAIRDMEMRATSMKRRLEMSAKIGSDLTAPGESLETPIHPSIAEDVRKSLGSKYMAAVASLQPRRLSPGDSGDLYVVVMLSRDAVVLPSSPLQLVIEEEKDSPFVFSSPELSPAEMSQFSKFFLHQPLYDDNIVFRVPMQVRPDAPAGKFSINATVEALLHKGKDGDEIGSFPAKVVGLLELGDPLPDAGLMSRSNEDDRVPVEAAVGEMGTTVELDSVSHTGETGPIPQPEGRMGANLEGAPEDLNEGLDPLGSTAGGRVSYMVWILGGGLGLLVGLLLLVRRR